MDRRADGRGHVDTFVWTHLMGDRMQPVHIERAADTCVGHRLAAELRLERRTRTVVVSHVALSVFRAERLQDLMVRSDSRGYDFAGADFFVIGVNRVVNDGKTIALMQGVQIVPIAIDL